MNSVLLMAVLLTAVSTESTVYDQRQTGKTNVRLEVKDAVIIAMGDGDLGGDYDYSYDYSDLTIKPPPPVSTTKAPTTSTTASPKPQTEATTLKERPSSSTTFKMTTSIPSMKTTFSSVPTFNLSQAPILLEPENSSIIFPSKNPSNGPSEPLKIPSGTRPEQIPVFVLQELLGDRPYDFLPVKSLQNNGQVRVRGNQAQLNAPGLPRRHCSPGFFLDSQNRCKRIVPKPIREKFHLP